ncbi:MAG TPA: thioesterase family protein [Bryobacteraceae bacterium]|nr:thioesterase family protein [Bryobacteraceae bacterium]
MDASANQVRKHEARLRVRYAETDQMGVVYHANYLVWMEIGRVEYVRSLGVNYKDLENEGFYLSVVGTHCRYLYPARYDQEVVVETWLLNTNPRVVEFGYEIRLAESGKLLADASSKHLWLSRDWRPIRLPAEYQRILYAGTNQNVSIEI